MTILFYLSIENVTQICYTKDTEREVDSNVSLNSEVLLRFDRVRRAVKRRLHKRRDNTLKDASKEREVYKKMLDIKSEQK